MSEKDNKAPDSPQKQSEANKDNINLIDNKIIDKLHGCFAFWGLPEPGFDCSTCNEQAQCFKQTVR